MGLFEVFQRHGKIFHDEKGHQECMGIITTMTPEAWDDLRAAMDEARQVGDEEAAPEEESRPWWKFW